MGLLRLLLALLVILPHSGAGKVLPVAGGDIAVRVFFVISGFYMALILSEKYREDTPRGRWLFYSNRALRIYPLLWIALAFELGVTALFVAAGHVYTGNHWLPPVQLLAEHGNWGALAVLAITQVTSLGVDVVYLFNVTPEGAMVPYTGVAQTGGYRGWSLFPMGQLWTVSCELLFYLCAPWLNRLRTRWLCLGLVASILAAYLIYRVLPKPVASVASGFLCVMQGTCFLAGMLSYRLTKTRWMQAPGAVRWGCVVALAAGLAGFSYLSQYHYGRASLALYAVAALALPFLFQASASSSWDRHLGDLSYPVYLLHVTVIRAGEAWGLNTWLGTSAGGKLGFALLAAGVTCLLAAVLVRMVDSRIDAWRQRRLTQAAPA